MFTVEAPQISAPPAAGLRERAVGSTGLAYLQIDRYAVIRDWNPAAEQIFGWTREEAVGKRMTELIVPPSLRSAHNAGFARYLVTGESETMGHPVDVPGMHRDGSELRLSMTIDSLGEDGFFAFVTDRTGGHRAQQELQRSNTLISAILQHTTAMISAKDLAGRYLFVNGEYERIFQVTAADMVGRSEADLLSAPVAAVGRTHDQEVAETGAAKTVLEEIPFGDEIRQYVVTRVPLTDPDGSVYGVCTIGIDDTGRRRSDEAVADSERRFGTTDRTAERRTELDLEAVRGDLDDLIGRLAVIAVTVPAQDGPPAALTALVPGKDQEALTGMWQSAARGERIDAVIAEGLLLRLRAHGAESITVSCFRIGGGA